LGRKSCLYARFVIHHNLIIQDILITMKKLILVKRGEAVNMVKAKKPAAKNLGEQLGFKKRKRPKFSAKKKKAKESL